MSTPLGRDGRLLVTTVMAAYSLGMQPGSFRKWAVRHGVRATASRPNPRRGQPIALWDLADITDRTKEEGRRPICQDP